MYRLAIVEPRHAFGNRIREEASWLQRRDSVALGLGRVSFGADEIRRSGGQGPYRQFLFATCPGTCNLQNTHLRAIAQQYGAKGVKFLSITTDPKVDSRAALSKYAGGFSANPDHWYFLRSDDIVYLRRIGAEMYKVGGVKEKGHQDIFVLVDKWGNLRLFCDWKTEKSRAELLAKIDELLAETEEPAHLDDGLDDEPRRPPGYEDELEEQAEEAAAAAAEEKAAEEQAAEEQAAEEQAAEEQAAEEQSAESVK